MKRRRTWFDRFSPDNGLMFPHLPFDVLLAAFNGGAGGNTGGDGSGIQGNSDGNGDAGAASGQTTNTGADGAAADGTQQTAKTFTQEQVTAMMTREKEQGRQAALKELGISDPAQAKAILEAATKLSDTTKPAGQKLDEKDQTIQNERAGREAAEQKLELVLAKAKPDHLDDILLLAKARVTDKVDFKSAVDLVKKAMPTFFNNDASGGESGTGDPPGGKKKKDDSSSVYGEKAAAISRPPEGAAGPDTFFKN